MFQSFSTELAGKIGLQEAVIVSVLAYRIMERRHTGLPKHSLYDCEYWETDGIASLARNEFAYVEERTLRRVFSTLEGLGIIKECRPQVARFNWYTFTDKGWKMLKDYGII